MLTNSRRAVICGIFVISCLAGCSANPVRLTERSTGAVDQLVKPVRPARVLSPSEYDFTVNEAVTIAGGVRNAYDQAIRLLGQGQHEQGVQALEAVVERAPQLTAPHIDLGIAYLKQGKAAQAENELKIALQLTPKHPVAANELGVVYRHMGKFELARLNFEQALDSFPNYHRAQRNLGIVCDLFLSDYPCALENYRAFQKAYPGDSALRIWIADVESRINTDDGALQ